ncbi:MAG: lytic transglycosylase domain-containing protein [Deltaproteobacteria bacterium]|nr:lytic transglycosylase domain-containing protein [Deltaproteobacteria bacterium]
MKRNLLTACFCAALLCSPVFSYADHGPAAQDQTPYIAIFQVQANTGCAAAFDGAAKHVYGPDESSGSGADPAADAGCQGPDDLSGPEEPLSGPVEAFLGPQACVVEEAAADPAADAGSIWDTYRADGDGNEDAAGPDIPIVVNKSVESHIRYFQTRGRKYFEKWLDRSRDYMTMLRSILRENGLPEDLSYIAFIESGLNPTVKSRANAVGMWQFIKGTARTYGLRVDWWIDERMDPEKATLAAAKYFRNLYGQFGSWYLAAAGYNAGEGKVMRVMRRHDSEDFWVLASRKRSFKRETREYVPKFLAAILIGKDPTAYGFEEQPDGALLYDKAAIPNATDFRVIATAAGTTVEEIKRLNPELLRRFTPPNYPDYEVKIPYGTKERFDDYMSKTPPSKTMIPPTR